MKFLKLIFKGIFKFILFVIREIISFFIKFILLFIILSGIVAVILKQSTEHVTKIHPNSYVKIDLSRNYNEYAEDIPEYLGGSEGSFYSLLEKLNHIKKDPNIDGLFIKLDNISIDNAQIEELAKKISELEEDGMNVIAYANNYDNRNYKLAVSSNATIYMPDTVTTGSDITGYYSELAYYKGLADKLGVDFNVIHVGDYKAFGENYTKKEMSKEFRANITELKDSVYENFVQKVSEKRDIPLAKFENDLLNGEFVAGNSSTLYKYGLIDYKVNESEILDDLGEGRMIDIDDYTVKHERRNGDKIAIIYLDGEIHMDDSESSDYMDGITPGKVFKQIDAALKDKGVKGIDLRINSPGGSALASNLINTKLKSIKDKKPIYVSIGGVAASGGYYIASAGDKIFADKESVTGSIGVVSIIPNFRKLLGKADVNISTVKKGKYSDLYSLTQNFTNEDRKKIYESSLEVYDEFLDIVAKSRHRTKEYINSIGEGRVWLGEKGKKIGLVDEIGGIEETIDALSKKLQLTKYDVVEIKDKPRLDMIIKRKIPFLKLYFKAETLINDRDFLFKPIYYFPYEI